MNDPTAWHDDSTNITGTGIWENVTVRTYTHHPIRVAPVWRIRLAWHWSKFAKWLERKIGGY